MDVHTLEAQQRRMLLEMLASERSGEAALRVGEWFGRDAIAHQLCRLRMAEWVDDGHVVFTAVGRRVAEALAERLGRPAAMLAS